MTKSPKSAARFVKQGGLVAFPTETVYGLGADVFDEAAVAKIFEAKERPADNPLIAHISHVEQIDELTSETNESARKFIEKFFPGPLTLVLRKSQGVPLLATAGLDTIGVRMPRSAVACEFLRACDTPLVAPSANLSGRPSPTTWQAVYEDLNGRIDCILQADATQIGLESTVVDCSGEAPILLREGAISLEELRSVVPTTTRARDGDSRSPRSPGLKHRHYSPKATVRIVDCGMRIADSDAAGFIGIDSPNAEFEIERICASVDEYAHSLFEFFRECDRRGVETIFCESVPPTGIGAALMDRIRRAAQD
ncbi:MAG: L-threonylcarbamoyladenylate synthase [Pyrinomonadaceae bacterium]